MIERAAIYVLTAVLASTVTTAPTFAQTTRPHAVAEIKLNFPDNVELKVLVDYVSQRLGINFFFDEEALATRVTVRAPAAISEDSLLPLLESILQARGLAIVDSPSPGWKRIVTAANLQQAATTRPAATRPSSVITAVISLGTTDAGRLEPLIRPLLTQPGGSLVVVAEQRLLIVTDFASNVQKIEQFIKLLDRERPASTTSFFQVQNVDAAQLATQLATLMAARVKSGADATAGIAAEIIPESRTNRLILIGTKEAIADAMDLARSLDVKLPVDTRAYRFAAISPERIDHLAKDMVDSAGAKGMYSSSIDTELATLIVTTTPAMHERIAALQRDMDRPAARGLESPIRFYKLQHSSAAEVLTTIEAITGESSLDGINVNGLGIAPKAPSPATAPPDATSAQTLPQPVTIPGTASQNSTVPQGLAANAEAPPVPPRTVRAKDATITADANTNSIIVVAPPATQFIYEQLIKTLDKRRPQVLVECTIVTLDTTGNYQFGVEVSGRGSSGSTDLITFSSFGLSSVGQTHGTGGSSAADDLGRLTLTPGVGFNGTVIGGDIADLVIRALTGSSHARVVSSPKLVVNDNVSGTLASVTEAPFTTTSALTGNTSSTSFGGFAQAGTTITLTPHISEGDQLQLEYSIALNSFTQEPQAGASTPPPRRSNQIQSKVTIPDGSTIVVGGLNFRSESGSKTGVPFLSQIPILEYLFSNRSGSQNESTLFVFIRPIILRDDAFADLKLLSERDVAAAAISGDYPRSVPLLMK